MERMSASEAGGQRLVNVLRADCRDIIVPNGQVRDVNFEEKFLVKQILALLNRLHCGTDEAAQCANVGEWHWGARECPPRSRLVARVGASSRALSNTTDEN